MKDVLVIGAGPAGSAAALLLSRAGSRVTLVEQHRFPRDKVCGECLSALGFDVMERIGMADALRSAGAVRLEKTILHAPGGAAIELRLPRPMWGISRAALDQMLLDAARDAGAAVLQPARCEQIKSGSAELRCLEANIVRRIQYEWLLLADGRAALLDRRPEATGDFGIKAHFEDVGGSGDAIELFCLGGCYGGLTRIEGERWNAAFAIPQARLRALRGDVSGVFQEMLHESTALRARMQHARRTSAWLAAPLPRFAVVGNWPQRVIPLGNAAAALEPIGGEGMGLALRSAELAAQALVEAHRSGRPLEPARLRARFAALWRARSLACRAAAVGASRGRLADRVLPVLDRNGRLLRQLLQFMGKD